MLRFLRKSADTRVAGVQKQGIVAMELWISSSLFSLTGTGSPSIPHSIRRSRNTRNQVINTSLSSKLRPQPRHERHHSYFSQPQPQPPRPSLIFPLQFVCLLLSRRHDLLHSDNDNCWIFVFLIAASAFHKVPCFRKKLQPITPASWASLTPAAVTE